jgi:hypothetical protein
MSAAQAKHFSSRTLANWLALAFFLLGLVAPMSLAALPTGPASASAKTPGAPHNRVWENSAATAQSRPVQGSQTPGLQRENSLGRYNDASGCTLAAENAARGFGTYEVLLEQAVSGLSRTAQRAAANSALYAQLQANPDLAGMFNQELGSDVISHLGSRAGVDLWTIQGRCGTIQLIIRTYFNYFGQQNTPILYYNPYFI